MRDFASSAALLFVLLAGLFSAQCHAEPLPKWELGVGAGVISLPDYRGSDEVHQRVIPIPYFVYRHEKLRVDRGGIKSTLFDSEHVELNVSMGFTPPVFSKQNRAREGMHDIRPLIEIGPSLDTHLWHNQANTTKLDLRLPVRAAVSMESQPRYTGVTFSPKLHLDTRNLAGTPWKLGVFAGPIFADQRQHDYLYGVSANEVRAGRPSYQAHGGYAGASIMAGLSRRMGKTWIGAFARYDNLRGAAFADSPLMRRDHYATFGLAMAWVINQSATMVDLDED